MSAWSLPTELTVGNVPYAIRTDFRVILDIFTAINDPDLFEPDASDFERQYVQQQVTIEILFEDFENIPPEYWNEAAEKAAEFIDCGIKDDGKRKPQTMDWEQDAAIMMPAINKVSGQEIRAVPYMHWWTFFGLYMEIGDSLFSQVIAIRQKQAQHKKLEKWEQDFYRENKEIIDLRRKYSAEELKEKEEWDAFFEEWGG